MSSVGFSTLIGCPNQVFSHNYICMPKTLSGNNRPYIHCDPAMRFNAIETIIGSKEMLRTRKTLFSWEEHTMYSANITQSALNIHTDTILQTPYLFLINCLFKQLIFKLTGTYIHICTNN